MARARGADRLRRPRSTAARATRRRSAATLAPDAFEGARPALAAPAPPASRSSPTRRARSPTRRSTRCSTCAPRHGLSAPSRSPRSRSASPASSPTCCATPRPTNGARAQVLDAVLRGGRARRRPRRPRLVRRRPGGRRRHARADGPRARWSSIPRCPTARAARVEPRHRAPARRAHAATRRRGAPPAIPTSRCPTRQLRDKFLACATPVLGADEAEGVAEQIAHLEDIPDIRALTSRLVTGRGAEPWACSTESRSSSWRAWRRPRCRHDAGRHGRRRAQDRDARARPRASDELAIRRTIHAFVNRNKRSMTLNMKSPEGQAIFRKLAAGADVIVEGFRPGVMKRLGAGYETLHALNPRLVYCSLSGFGQDGPYRDYPAHDMNYLSLGRRAQPHRRRRQQEAGHPAQPRRRLRGRQPARRARHRAGALRARADRAAASTSTSPTSTPRCRCSRPRPTCASSSATAWRRGGARASWAARIPTTRSTRRATTSS